jgi:hypothetical protein
MCSWINSIRIELYCGSREYVSDWLPDELNAVGNGMRDFAKHL